MDTRFLDSFIAAVELGSLAEAARRLNLTPAAVAQRVKALEQEFGTKLLARAGRTVGPTEAGTAVFQKARGLLRDFRDMRAMATGDVAAGELRLGAISTALTGILPEILSRLAESYPQLGVFVAPGTSVELHRRVMDGDLDAAIVVRPPFPLPKAVSWRLLREEPLVLISHSALRDRSPRDLLSNEPFVRYDRNHWGGRLADGYLRYTRIRPRERFELDALEAIAVLVDRGLGVSLVPDWAPPWPAGLSLRKRLVSAPGFQRQVGLLWMRGSAQNRLIRAFLMGGVGS